MKMRRPRTVGGWSVGLAVILVGAVGCLAAEEPDAAAKENETIFRADAGLEIKGLLIAAHQAADRKAWDDAEAAFHKILELAVPDVAKHDALLDMGRMFETNKAYAKVAMVYEGFLERFPNDPAAADVSIRLGRACRELGAFQTALAKFYNALNSSLRLTGGDDVLAAQKKLALKAQFEIAQTHFAKGDYAEAKRFFTRLLALDMTPEDRELVQFRLASTTALLGNPGEAAALAKQFLQEHPDSDSAAETYYLLSQSLQKLGRNDEATQVTLKLLQQEQSREKSAPEVWRRWKLRTGSELASALYENGDAMHALTIYQRLADLDPSPENRWPMVYQIALCFERLRLTQRALEAYTYLVNAPLPTTTAANAVATDLPALKDMAQWKIDYLNWATNVDRDLSRVLKPDWQTAGIQPLKFRETPAEVTDETPAASPEP